MTHADRLREWADEIDNNAEWSGDENIGVAREMRAHADDLDRAQARPQLAPTAVVGRRGPWWARVFRPADPLVWEGDQT